MRNILETVPKKNSKPFREAMKAIFRLTDIRLARVAKDELVSAYAENINMKKLVKNWMKASKMPFNIQ